MYQDNNHERGRGRGRGNNRGGGNYRGRNNGNNFNQNYQNYAFNPGEVKHDGQNTRWRGNFNNGNPNRGNRQENNDGRSAQRNHGKPFSDEVANYGISYEKIQDICKAMDEKKILPGSSDLLIAVQVSFFRTNRSVEIIEKSLILTF